MVVAAIISLQDPVGSHPEDISRWIEVRPSPGLPYTDHAAVLCEKGSVRFQCQLRDFTVPVLLGWEIIVLLLQDDHSGGSPSSQALALPACLCFSTFYLKISARSDLPGKQSGNMHELLAQSHYAVAPSFKRTVRGTLRRMVDAGRLETVPNHINLFRLGGVVRQLSQEVGMEWPRAKPGFTSLDSRVLHSPLTCKPLVFSNS